MPTPTRRRAGLTSLLLLLAVAAAPAEPVSELARQFFTNPRFASVEISPGGKHIAVLHSDGGREQIVVRSLPDGAPTPIVALPDPEARFRWLHWASDERLLFGIEEPMRGGGPPPRPRRSRLYAINADGSGYTHLAKNWARFILVGRGDFQIEDDVIDFLDDDPGHILIAVRKPTDYYPGAYRLDVATGGLEPVAKPLDGVISWHADHRGEIRAGSGYEHKKFRLFARVGASAELEEIAAYTLTGEPLSFEGFAPEPQTIYVSKANEEGYDALYEYDLKTRSFGREIFAAKGYDVPAWLEYSADRKTLAAVGYFAEGPRRHFLDPEAAAEQERLDLVLPHTFNRILSETKDRSRAIVYSSSDTRAPVYWLYDAGDKKLTRLFSRYPLLDGRRFAPMQAVSYEARDGRTIPGFLTLPLDRSATGLPAVIYPHGGPSARDTRGFDRDAQYLAALGFAVLQPNFRGSTGYGRDHLEAGFREWGLTMQDDLSDAVAWLVGMGIADAKRVAIYGASYGGYAALMGLVKTPELFRCAAAYAAPTDLVMLLNHQKGYMFSDVNVPLVGSATKDRSRLKGTSPLESVAAIKAPVFLAHGEDDDRVHVAHSQKLAKALKKAGKRVELMVIEDEAHSLRDEERRIELYERLGRFLLTHTAKR